MSETDRNNLENKSCNSCRIIRVAGPFAITGYTLYAYINPRRITSRREGNVLLLIAFGFSMLGTYTLLSMN